MIPTPDHKPREQHFSIRMDARLDQTTRQKVDELATRFHQPRATVLCHIMQWGLSHRQTATLEQIEKGPVCHLYLSVESKLHERVQKAGTTAGLKIASWLRHMVRQITITDFPASWQEATPRERSHDSRMYLKRFMLRLDEPSQTKLLHLVAQLHVSRAAIIRHLLAQAKPEDFPSSWQLKTAERRA
jgi:predicted transcriptional regulator